jgi:GxxExxY protein
MHVSNNIGPQDQQLHLRMRREFERSKSSATTSATPSAILYKELSYAIVGAAIEVHRHMGPGQLEANYERAFARELSLRAIPFRRQTPFASYYKGEAVGEFVADLIVDERVIVELKAVERIHPSARAQLIGYLRATGIRLGLLINFNEAVVHRGIKRIVL